MMSDNRSFFNAKMRCEEEETTEEINAREDVMVSNAARQLHNIRKECYSQQQHPMLQVQESKTSDSPIQK